MERLSAALRDSTLDVRMVAIGTTFGRFKRLVRDLSSELGKEIDLVTEGAETELDKTVIERLGDPLVHLIRNSCDHGIESARRPARRGEAGPGHAATLAPSTRAPASSSSSATTARGSTRSPSAPAPSSVASSSRRRSSPRRSC